MSRRSAIATSVSAKQPTGFDFEPLCDDCRHEHGWHLLTSVVEVEVHQTDCGRPGCRCRQYRDPGIRRGTSDAKHLT